MSVVQEVASREAVAAVLDRYDAACAELEKVSFTALTCRESLAVLARREKMVRAGAGVEHRLIAQLTSTGTPGELGATKWSSVLAERLRISTTEANRRLDEAADLGPRTTLSGEVLDPTLPTFAAGIADGTVGAENVKIARAVIARIPAFVDVGTRVDVEVQLGQLAARMRPEDFCKAAAHLLFLLNQDGEFSDADRERRRELTIGKQGPDGMSYLSGWLDPEARATWEPILAKLAAPGMCNPEDESPQVDGEPSDEAVKRDQRTQSQRNHDAFKAAGRAVLASGELGQLNGLPVAIIVSTTIEQLHKAIGQAVTAGGTRLPMSDVIRMASHAVHYLAIFTKKKSIPLYLGRQRRFASPGQRIVLHARDRGCTRPGCTAPGYRCQAHHAECDWAQDGQTNVDTLTLACGPCNRLVKKGGWRTRIRRDGRVEWIPPPDLDVGQPRVNNFHHPERLLLPDEDGD
jgi:Domain of unknown function (DUF222)